MRLTLKLKEVPPGRIVTIPGYTAPCLVVGSLLIPDSVSGKESVRLMKLGHAAIVTLLGTVHFVSVDLEVEIEGSAEDLVNFLAKKD